MASHTELGAQTTHSEGHLPRDRLLEGMPVAERRIEAAGVSTPLLEGGQGPPLVLLHGQGGFAAMWGLVVPALARSNRVLAPDLPGLGESQVTGELDPTRVVAWLGELIDQTCDEPPTVVGHSLGGTIAARLAIEHSDRVGRLVLVDSGSLGRFRPAPGVMIGLLRFSARPSRASHERFLSRVFVDPDRLRAGWGERWEAFEAYHIDRAADSSVGAANRQLLMRLGVRRIPGDRLGQIEAPTALIWGREDPIMRFRIAEEVAARLGWPLYPIDDCGHVPQAERPQAFLEALRPIVGSE
jgi:pimeloyl-ACP methyl ester carboxylesterase